MKNVVIAIIANLFVVNAAFADKVVAKLVSVDEKIKTVELTEDGLLKVLKTDASVKTLKLSPYNKSNLVINAQYLADVETKTETHLIVCMMMINPLYMTDLLVANQENQLTMVLSYKSCAVSTFTHPVNEYQQQSAEQLKEKMLVLAHQLVK